MAFIAINIAVYLWGLFFAGIDRMAVLYGAVPAALFGRAGYMEISAIQPLHPAVTLLTSMFLHGGLLHIAGNMLYLWIFGNNIEDTIGHIRFVIFYLLAGLAAAFSHAISSPGSAVPMVGASGAVAGVLGAYLLLYPRARVHTLVFLGFFVTTVRLPALIVIGFWAIIQVVSGLGSAIGGAQGGVAWFAHVGGFIFGIAAVKIFMLGKSNKRRVEWS